MIHQTKRSQNFRGELSSHVGVYWENMFKFRLSQNFKEIGATFIRRLLRGGGVLRLLNNYNEIVFDTESKLVIFYSLTNS